MSVILKSYSTTLHNEGVIDYTVSALEVEVSCGIFYISAKDCCRVCPNRIQKLMGYVICTCVAFQLDEDELTGDIKEAALTCNHIQPPGKFVGDFPPKLPNY